MVLSPEERRTAPTLEVGDQAPPLAVSEWVRGGPVDRFEPGRVYLLDFWAVWCGPCLASMPGTSALERAHPGELVVVAMTTIDDANTPGRIRATARRMGADMPSTVAIDEGDRTARSYRVAARDMAVPRSFLVDQSGRLAWIGHPADAEAVVEQVIKGQWNVEQACRERRQTVELESTARSISDALRELPDNDVARELELLKRLQAIEPKHRGWYPASAVEVGVVRCQIELGDIAAARVTANAVEREWADDSEALASLALVVVPIDGEQADRLSARSLELVNAALAAPEPTDAWERYLHGAEEPRIAQTMATIAAVEFARGRPAEAVTIVSRAIDLGRDAGFPDWLAGLERRRARYAAAAGE